VRRLYGIEDYHLRPSQRRRPVWWMAHKIALALLLLPSALVGVATSGPAYLLVSWIAPRIARRYDQYDTSKIVLGIMVYATSWSGLVALVAWRLGTLWAVAATVALPLTFASALAFRALAARILEAGRILVLFRRRPRLRDELVARRREIEHDLAILAQRARGSGSPPSEPMAAGW
jgi:hypothetical protein